MEARIRVLCDRKVPPKFKGKFFRVVVGSTIVIWGRVLTSQELSRLKNESGGDEDAAMDVWAY